MKKLLQLFKYKSKRDLKVSPEPAAKIKTKKSKELIFVIQEHHASHLHYDFRIEVDGVLKSWAIPKKPSTNPAVKRLAIMVEDHPYAYKDFEGVIPSGYGAGTVNIWDKGTYSVDEEEVSYAQKKIQEGLKKGSLHFTLKGEKLKGIFCLVRLKTGEEKQWLFFKKSGAES